ncbi:uncharacterized protein LOC125040080 isoform X2 [Penaeus chinensis]|uniref:uncharacterized protein LOC125040080 isoform X2 n=1 Tax=Penaeus chinensis TaxID=139456 RepID=UPI001FB6156B|nr:uncharacterized protein LOC125040080 isoform X2 [Penaeus chinensis]
MKQLRGASSLKMAGVPGPPATAEAHRGMRKEPRLHAGACPGHGGFQVFWCRPCRTWLCSDCTIVDHPQGTCSVVSMKAALEDFQSEGRRDAEQLALRLERALSLKDTCVELSTSSRSFLQAQNEFLSTLLREEEELKRSQEENVQRIDKLARLEAGLAEDCDMLPEGQQQLAVWTGHAAKAPSTEGMEATQKLWECFEKLQASFHLLTTSAFLPPPAEGPKDLPAECQSVSDLQAVLALDTDMCVRGLLLERTEGTFDWEDMCELLGRENVEHLEQVLEGVYLATVSSQRVRDYIVAKIWTIRFHSGQGRSVVRYGHGQGVHKLPRASGVFVVHSARPVGARVKGVLAGIPSFVESRSRQGLVRAIASKYPSLQDVSLEAATWPGTTVRSGTLEVRGVTTDLVALDAALRSEKGVVRFGLFRGSFQSLTAEPLSEEDILPTEPFQQGSSVKGWSWPA